MQRSLISLLVAALFAMVPQSVHAHAGPPFPILVDQPIPGYSVTVWADPDIGEALFYVVLEPSVSADLPPVAKLSFSVEPVNGVGPMQVYPVQQEKARGHLRYVATPEFSTQDFWTIRINIQLADGTTHPLLAEVESTPPGLGAWDLVIYLLPFLLFGGLWSVVFVRNFRVKRSRKQTCDSSTAERAVMQNESVA